LVVVLAVSGCGAQDKPAPGALGAPADTTAPAGLEEVPPGYDESPDGAQPVRDEELDDAALTALLRTGASAPADGHCAPDQVRVVLEGFDMALGHRYTRVVVRNASRRTCLVEGVPGIGVRGAWGSRFVPEVVHDGSGGDGEALAVRPVRLGPGERAVSDLAWSGDLAGAESEQASLIVVQLARGQVPVAVPAVVGGTPLDIGQFTTLRLTPLRAAG